MLRYKVVITDFGAPDSDIEAAEFGASGLDIHLLRLNAHTPGEMLPHVVDADALMVGFAPVDRQVINREGHHGGERARLLH